MTGKHTGHAYVRGNQQARDAEGQLPLPADAVTIASVLRRAGFATGMFGKWGLGNPGTTGDPLKHGWDTYFGYTDQIRAHNYFPDFLLKDGRRIPLDNEVQYLSPQAWHKGIGSYSTKQNVYSHDLIERAALDFIRKYNDGPFFAYLPFTLPHDNGEAPRLQMEVPGFGRYAKHKDWTLNSRGYAEMVTRLDRSVGRVIDLLDELGISENTLVIFTSDNGPVAVREDKPDRMVTAFFRSNGEFRGTKGTFYEVGVRVPMIARWTSRITHGVTSDHPSAHWDFFATVCDLIDVPAPPDIDGISYLPTLLGNDARQREREYLYWEGGGKLAIRKGDWKVVVPDGRKPDAAFELYDLASDPREQRDLASRFPSKVNEFRAMLMTVRSASERFLLPVADQAQIRD
jgi:arylsulfatase A